MGSKRLCCTRNNNSNQHNKIKKIIIKPITKSKRLFTNQVVITSKVNNLAKYSWWNCSLKNELRGLNTEFKNIQIKTLKY
jgi:hypothetical protein